MLVEFGLGHLTLYLNITDQFTHRQIKTNSTDFKMKIWNKKEFPLQRRFRRFFPAFLVGGWKTPLTNMSQNGNLPQIGTKISNVWVATTQFFHHFFGTSIPFQVTFCRDQLHCPKGCLKKPRAGGDFVAKLFRFLGGNCFGNETKKTAMGKTI